MEYFSAEGQEEEEDFGKLLHPIKAAQEFHTLTQDEKPVVAEFYAPWYGAFSAISILLLSGGMFALYCDNKVCVRATKLPQDHPVALPWLPLPYFIGDHICLGCRAREIRVFSCLVVRRCSKCRQISPFVEKLQVCACINLILSASACTAMHHRYKHAPNNRQMWRVRCRVCWMCRRSTLALPL